MATTVANFQSESAEKAIPRLLDEHGGLIYRLGREFCGSHEGAQDLVQETFLRAFKSWSHFKGQSSPATWLYTIAARTCRRLKYRRSGEPERMQSLSELLPSPDDEIPDLISSGQAVLDEVERKTMESAVHQAIGKLPVGFRMALVLKDIVEFSVAEVALILNIKEATVKTRVHRARLLLRKELSRSIPTHAAPLPDHSRRVCLDLLKAKQDSIDRGVPFPLGDGELCARCKALFATLDLAHEMCATVRQNEMPESLRELLLREFGTTPS